MPKNKKVKSTKDAKPAKKKHVFQDPNIEEIVEVEIEFMCPKRGLVKQKVKMKRLKMIKDSKPKTFQGASSIIDDLEQEENERILSEEPVQEE